MCATAFALVALLTGCVETPTAATPVMYRSLAAAGARVDQAEAADLLNGHRRLKGLAPMSADPALERIAASAARELADRDQPDAIVAAHARSALAAAHVSTAHVAQNLSGGYFTLADAFSGWRGAPRQERTISLPAATRFGIASAYAPGSKYTVYWALVVAGP
ncbi:MAG: CAP domain-containing protein [Hyphomicrobiales bacterium]